MRIFGAGLSGLLAGCTFNDAIIYEANVKDSISHKALLRFRSPAVGNSVGIDFKKVRVHKGIWDNGKFVSPNPRVCNQYSQKVIGRLSDRSIWNIDPVDRYIAPDDFIQALIERCQSRIVWEYPVTVGDILSKEPTISTLPMGSIFQMLFRDYFGKEDGEPLLDGQVPEFKHKPILVKRFRIPGANVHQTIYFPDPDVYLYRASITGDLVIAEYIQKKEGPESFGESDHQLTQAFGIPYTEYKKIDDTQQQFGKIAEIDNDWRKQFIFKLSHELNIFSLGRFGTWRNILLDDVLDDLATIKKLMRSGIYEVRKHIAKVG